MWRCVRRLFAAAKSVAQLMAEPYPPTLAAAQARIAAIRPSAYARTRNAINDAVSGLSPYITHGLVSLGDMLAGMATWPCSTNSSTNWAGVLISATYGSIVARTSCNPHTTARCRLRRHAA